MLSRRLLHEKDDKGKKETSGTMAKQDIYGTAK